MLFESNSPTLNGTVVSVATVFGAIISVSAMLSSSGLIPCHRHRPLPRGRGPSALLVVALCMRAMRFIMHLVLLAPTCVAVSR